VPALKARDTLTALALRCDVAGTALGQDTQHCRNHQPTHGEAHQHPYWTPLSAIRPRNIPRDPPSSRGMALGRTSSSGKIVKITRELLPVNIGRKGLHNQSAILRRLHSNIAHSLSCNSTNPIIVKFSELHFVLGTSWWCELFLLHIQKDQKYNRPILVVWSKD
jgi:hypothetical protein